MKLLGFQKSIKNIKPSGFNYLIKTIIGNICMLEFYKLTKIMILKFDNFTKDFTNWLWIALYIKTLQKENIIYLIVKDW